MNEDTKYGDMEKGFWFFKWIEISSKRLKEMDEKGEISWVMVAGKIKPACGNYVLQYKERNVIP